METLLPAIFFFLTFGPILVALLISRKAPRDVAPIKIEVRARN